LFTVLVALVTSIVVALAKSLVAGLTGSASIAAEAAHSWADVGNELLLVVAEKRSRRDSDDEHPAGYGREAYIWSLLAAAGMFVVGALFAVAQGGLQIARNAPVADLPIGLTVLAVSAVFEAISLVQAMHRARRAAAQRAAVLISHVLVTPDPTLRAVVAQDVAALIGVAIAGLALLVGHQVESGIPDGIGSIAVGVGLAAIAAILIDRNRRFLIGEVVEPELHDAAMEWLLGRPEVESVSYLHLEYAGPEEVSVTARVSFVADLPESVLAPAIRRIEQEAEAYERVRICILSLSPPAASATKVCRSPTVGSRLGTSADFGESPAPGS
jgi:cation diffusion facilitator family transporter